MVKLLSKVMCISLPSQSTQSTGKPRQQATDLRRLFKIWNRRHGNEFKLEPRAYTVQAERVNHATRAGYSRVMLVSPVGEPEEGRANSQYFTQIFTYRTLFYYGLTILSTFQISALGQICGTRGTVKFGNSNHIYTATNLQKYNFQ